MTELATDLFRGLSHLCRNCLVDLTESVREHLISCAEATRLDAENVRAKARALHEKRALPSARRLNDFMMRPALLEPKPRRRARRKPKSRRLRVRNDQLPYPHRRGTKMEVIAVAEPEDRWRWEIRHGGTVVKRSDERFETARDAIEEGKRRLLTLWTGEDRPPISRRLQGRSSHRAAG